MATLTSDPLGATPAERSNYARRVLDHGFPDEQTITARLARACNT